MKENFLRFRWLTIIIGIFIISYNCLVASHDEEIGDSPSILVLHNPVSLDKANKIINDSGFLTASDNGFTASDEDDEKFLNLPPSSILQGSSSFDVTDRTLDSTSTSGILNTLQGTNSIGAAPANDGTLSSSSSQVLPPAIPRSDGSAVHSLINDFPGANCIKCCLKCHDNYCQSYTKIDFNDPAYAESRKQGLSIGSAIGGVISIVLIPAWHSLPFFLAYFSDQSRELAIASMAINSAYTLIYTGRAAILPKRSNRYLTALTIIGGAGGLTTSGFSAAYLMAANNVWRLVNTGLNAGIGAANLILHGLTVKPLFKKIWTNCFSSSQSQTS